MVQDLISAVWTASAPPRLAPRDWELLLAQARRSRLLGRLARLYADRGWLEGAPAAPRQHLLAALRLVERQLNEVRWEVDRIGHALQHLQTPLVLLKGAAYVAAGLPPARGRLFSDVDLMIAKPRLRDAEAGLLAAGWAAERLDPYDERYYREWMHELPPLQHVQRMTTLDLHHTITPPTSRFRVDGAKLLERVRMLPGGHGIAVLAPEDMVIHSAVHLLQDGDFSGALRDLLDLDDLVRHFADAEPAFWRELPRRARELRLGAPLHQALSQAGRLFGTQLPPEAAADIAALAPPAPRRAAMALLLRAAVRPDHPSCDSAFSGIARFALYARSHWLRMPWYQIVPHLVRKAWKRARAERDKPKQEAV